MKFYVEPIKDVNDIDRLKKWFKEYDIRYYTIFMIGLYSGLRISDILGLNEDDVKEKSFIEVVEQKTGKTKKFPLNEELQETIKKYLDWKEENGIWGADKKALFIGKQYGRLDRSQVYRIINRAIANLGIEGNFGTHTMRKTFGYHHYKQNHDVALLQKIFNHSSPSITLRYIGIEQEEINASYKTFSYDYGVIEKNAQEARQTRDKNHRINFKDIENALEYLLTLYKKIDKKMDKILLTGGQQWKQTTNA